MVPAFLLLCSKTLAYINKKERFSFGYGQNVFIFFNAISQQVTRRRLPHSCNHLSEGSEIEPRMWPSRLVFLIMMVSSVVLFENYAASYTAFLAVVRLAAPFDSLLDMYENTDYKIGARVSTPYKNIITAVSEAV